MFPVESEKPALGNRFDTIPYIPDKTNLHLNMHIHVMRLLKHLSLPRVSSEVTAIQMLTGLKKDPLILFL